MGNLHLVTGYAGYQHITSADQAVFNAQMFGGGQYVLATGNQLAASAITNNLVRVLDGDIMMQGRHIRLNEENSVDLAIENGAQGYSRNDLIVVRYTKNGDTGIEDANLMVIKGAFSDGTPADPAYTSGDLINENAAENDMPLYRVQLDGLNISAIVPLFEKMDGSVLEKLKEFESHSHNASDITAGMLPVLHGGTGRSVFAANRLLYTKGNTALSELPFPTAAGSVLRQDINGAPYWSSPEALAANMMTTRIITGSYTGKGFYGANNPTSITLPTAIKFLWVFAYAVGNSHGSTCVTAAHKTMASDKELTTSWVKGAGIGLIGTNDGAMGKKSADGKTFLWFSTESAAAQYNEQDTEYFYIAVV